MLALGQRGDLKKMADTLNRNDIMRWHAVLALRLAVLFCRARLPLQLPQGLSLQYDNPTNSYTLKAPQAWLDNNPLTAAALQEEAEQWQKIEHQFNVVAQ